MWRTWRMQRRCFVRSRRIKLEPFTVLSVGNLPNEITVDELADVFNDYGRVQNCVRNFLPNGEYLTTGTVKMDKQGALMAIEDLKSIPVMGNILELRELAVESKTPWVEQEYEQMNEAPNSRAQWAAQAKRWASSRKKP